MKRKKTPTSSVCDCSDARTSRDSVWEGIGMLLLVIVAYTIVGKRLLPSFDTSVGQVASLGGVFVVGALASMSSCLALVGGLLLSVSATYAQATQGQRASVRMTPLLQFNAGRIAGYVVLGGLVGVIGNSMTLSTHATGVVTLVLAVVMLSMGLSLLRIVPKNVCTIPLPRSWVQRLRSASSSRMPAMPFALGAATFFVPCGFTQSMQLLALASGSFTTGALIMGTFALGTLPALLGISVLSSAAEGRSGRLFIRFSGAVVTLLAIFNLQAGLVLSGVNIPEFGGGLAADSDPNVSINAQGQQIISLSVQNDGYSPASVTIDPNRETWIYASAKDRPSGCASMLTAPAFNLSVPVQKGGNWLGPIQNPTKDFLISCSMGMLRTNVHVRKS